MRNFDGISDSVNVRQVRPVVVVNQNAACLSKFYSRSLCQFRFRPHAERKNNRPRRNLFAAFKEHGRIADFFYAVFKDKF